MEGSSIVDKRSLYTSNPNTNRDPKPNLGKTRSTWRQVAKEAELSGRGFKLRLPSRQEGAGNRMSTEGLCV